MGKQLARCFTCGKYGGDEKREDEETGRGGRGACSNALLKSERKAAQKDERLQRLEDKAYDDFNEYYEEDCGG